MYLKERRKDVIRIPPNRLGEDIDSLSMELTRESFEGQIVGNDKLILLTTNISPIGDGRIVHGDGAVYQDVEYDAIIFQFENNEIIEGEVCEVLKFGAFVRFGPLDGLLHISQVMDDHIDIDENNQRLLGKESKKSIGNGDKVKARIVAVSVNERSPRESKIGLTMRQPGLGKQQWLEDKRNVKDSAE